MDRYFVGLLLGALGAILFSAKAIIVKLAYRYGANAEALLALRMGLALPFFAGIAYHQRSGAHSFSPRQWFNLIGVGLLGYYAASYLDFLGLQYIPAALERLILFLYPTLVLLFAKLFFGRSLHARQWWALGMSYLGILLAFVHDISSHYPHLWQGAFLILASAICYALYLLLGGELLQQLGTLRLTAWASCIAALASILQFFGLHPWTTLILPWQVYALSIVNALFCTVIPVFCIMLSIEMVGAEISAQIGMLGPISTLILAMLFLDEAITIWHIVGTIVVLIGILMIGKSASLPKKTAKNN